ncbi:citrate/2-methylcitrate synthase [Jiangella mangrovi]|uniref:citrate synthase (unknown stereospecificity) n=1 Tax=Jiangella mangrovi TaxID=1524084 RepID=A0A7W9GQR7_9ACTN|nr:citrate/2-methylcitrate synthase [Jiangella mangrovi]MBB5788167.1 citrate synthase [Jiangella mangrovi]
MAQKRRLTTQQVAARLGVKPETVYAYVSRGLLSSRRGPGGRASTFDPDQVERLAHRRRGEPGGPVPRAQDAAGPVYSAVTLIEDDAYHYHGVDAIALARRYRFEEVAWWLWTGALEPGVTFTAPAEALAAARAAGAALPPQAGLVDRLRVAAVAAATVDPVRFDLRPRTVAATTRGLIATFADSLPRDDPRVTGSAAGDAGTTGGAAGGIAARLWPRLTARPADADAVAILDTALVLLIDHGLAASTVTARTAASARAHPYAVVSAALGTLEGPLHGAASGLAHRMLTDVLERGAGTVVAEHLRAGRRIPGLGHRLYRETDPRAELLFDLLAAVPEAEPVLAAARAVTETAATHLPLPANIDLALATLSVATAMPPEAGETILAVARTAGWIAHALEEYDERALRVRVTGRYEGPPPPQPLPEPSAG